MSETLTEPKLIAQYEDIRRREHDLITDMLNLLPKISNMEDDNIGQVRDALFHADHPFLMVFVGPFSSGKSSIINALLGKKDLLKIGPTPTTDRISILRWGDEPQVMDSGGTLDTVFFPSSLLKKVSFVDTPGLESVIQQHEETTNRFLHRADVVVLVMLATQAMTARNLEYLQKFREYGKKIIIVINQVDLLTDDEQQTVAEYVLNQSHDKLGYKPEIWLVSARVGLQAWQGEKLDKRAWKNSNLGKFEEYVESQLGDAERLRQKLQTPLQILQNVHHSALDAVRENQATFDQYRGITDNIDRQIDVQKRDQQKIIRNINEEVDIKFNETIANSEEALREVFKFTQAFRSLWRGLGEMVGVARLFRRGDQTGYVEAAFAQNKVFEPINELPEVVDRLGPRLESSDMQAIDDLVKYGQREIESLPTDLSDKVIGAIQAPIKYNRSILKDVRPELEQIEEQAKVLETRKLDDAMRATLLYLATWESIIFIVLVALVIGWDAIGSDQPLLPIILLIVLLSFGLLGFVLMPIRGRIAHTSFANRLLKLQGQYREVLKTATDKQLEYGVQLRQEAITPLTRLIEAQAVIHDEQLAELQTAEQEMVSIETDLNTLGKRNILGMKV